LFDYLNCVALYLCIVCLEFLIFVSAGMTSSPDFLLWELLNHNVDLVMVFLAFRHTHLRHACTLVAVVLYLFGSCIGYHVLLCIAHVLLMIAL